MMCAHVIPTRRPMDCIVSVLVMHEAHCAAFVGGTHAGFRAGAGLETAIQTNL